MTAEDAPVKRGRHVTEHRDSESLLVPALVPAQPYRRSVEVVRRIEWNRRGATPPPPRDLLDDCSSRAGANFIDPETGVGGRRLTFDNTARLSCDLRDNPTRGPVPAV